MCLDRVAAHPMALQGMCLDSAAQPCMQTDSLYSLWTKSEGHHSRKDCFVCGAAYCAGCRIAAKSKMRMPTKFCPRTTRSIPNAYCAIATSKMALDCHASNNYQINKMLPILASSNPLGCHCYLNTPLRALCNALWPATAPPQSLACLRGSGAGLFQSCSCRSESTASGRGSCGRVLPILRRCTLTEHSPLSIQRLPVGHQGLRCPWTLLSICWQCAL